MAAFGLLASSLTTFWLLAYAREAPDDRAVAMVLAACTAAAAIAAVVNLAVLGYRLLRRSNAAAADDQPEPRS